MSKKNHLAARLTQSVAAAASTAKAGETLQERLSTGEGQGLRAAMNADDRVSMSRREIPFEELQGRKEQDIRDVLEEEVVSLAISIANLGLLQFPVVDQDLSLLAGAHRMAAIALLRDAETMPEDELRARFARGGEPSAVPESLIEKLRSAFRVRFAGGVPVNVFDTAPFGDEAQTVRLMIEVVENEFRKNFRPKDVGVVIERFRATGLYREGPGRPKPGEVTLAQAVGQLMKVSRTVAFKLIDEATNGPKEKPKLNPSLKQLAEELSERFSTKIVFVAGPGQSGKLVVHYGSHKQRIDLLDVMKLKKKDE